MAKSKWCTKAQRQIIQQMKSRGYAVGEIASTLNCARKIVYNANLLDVQKCYTNHKTEKNHPQTRFLHLRSNCWDPFITSNDSYRELLSKFGISISSRTIRRRLNKRNLRDCIVQHKPKEYLKLRISFVRQHLEKPIDFWKNVLWSDLTENVSRMRNTLRKP